jgi:hypothetical protein
MRNRAWCTPQTSTGHEQTHQRSKDNNRKSAGVPTSAAPSIVLQDAGVTAYRRSLPSAVRAALTYAVDRLTHSSAILRLRGVAERRRCMTCEATDPYSTCIHPWTDLPMIDPESRSGTAPAIQCSLQGFMEQQNCRWVAGNLPGILLVMSSVHNTTCGLSWQIIL